MRYYHCYSDDDDLCILWERIKQNCVVDDFYIAQFDGAVFNSLYVSSFS